MSQTDLFGASPDSVTPASCEAPDPDAIRARLHAMLKIVRTAGDMPWEPPRARAQEHLFHNMANWLPEEEERHALRQSFAAEMRRLYTSAAV
jgi:hypothetical protein